MAEPDKRGNLINIRELEILMKQNTVEQLENTLKSKMTEREYTRFLDDMVRAYGRPYIQFSDKDINYITFIVVADSYEDRRIVDEHLWDLDFDNIESCGCISAFQYEKGRWDEFKKAVNLIDINGLDVLLIYSTLGLFFPNLY